jgi:RND superfamily putative drug exporter
MAKRSAVVIAIGGLLGGLALIGLVGEATIQPSPTASLPRDADSTSAAQLQEQLPAEDTSAAVALFTVGEAGGGEQFTAVQLQQVGAAVQTARGELGLPDGEVGLRPSPDGTAAIAVLPVEAVGATDVSEAITDLRSTLAEAAPPGVSALVTGPAAVEADLSAVFEGADSSLLLTTAAVVAVLLLLTYRSPILWIVPLVVVGIADRLAAVLATQALSGLGLAWDESTVGILSVLVFGAGTDYALLLISRYRDELRQEEDRWVAMSRALARTAEAVLSSSITVVLGLLTLLLSLFPTTRGLGVACAVGVVIAAAFALTVLPATLVLFGRWVFWPRIPRVGQPQLVDSRSIWRRVGDQVAARPVAFIVASMLLLAAGMTGLLRLETGLSGADQFLDKPEAIVASERLGESFPAGSSDPIQILTRDDPQRVVAAARGVDGVVGAEVAASGGGVSQVDVVLASEPGTDAAADAILAVRGSLADVPDTYVGGTEAQALDAADSASRDRQLILPLIVVLVLGALVLLLRSLVAPILLVLTVVATYLASLGLSWWLFTQLLGFPALDVGVPLLAFLFLVALGVDYNIFLVTRAREEARAHGAVAGMLRALTATGGVITSAGILLAAVFAVLGVLPLVVLAQLGLVICIGVLLDTLLVRTVVVPALGVALGERFWWPRRVSDTAPEAEHSDLVSTSP